jgi:hexosaminidase
MNKYAYILAFIFLLSFTACKFDNKKHLESPVIPRPMMMYPGISSFTFNQNTKIVIEGKDSSMLGIAQRLKLMIDSIGQFDLAIQNMDQVEGVKNIVLLSGNQANDKYSDGGYRLKVDRDKLVVQANKPEGVFNGVSTLQQIILLQMVDSIQGNDLEIPDLNIWDNPKFQYRGVHLDVGRHFFPVSFIKKYLDVMALYKFNFFHWHLTEDQGWRIEIKAYPKLTEVGAWRKDKDGNRYGGFYTQEEIKEVVKYAENLHITIIPEIEMPGHSRAAIAAYPELSCSGKALEVPNRWGVFEDVYCAGNEYTFEFLEKVLDEVMELFPGQYIHIGGDECPKTRWESCEKCQRRMKEEGLVNEHELQSYFIQRIEKYLNEHGKKLIGWDEILEGGLAPDATLMSWRGIQGGIDAARQEHQVIMTPGEYCYFDHYQANPEYEPRAIGGYLPLKKVYDFNPIPKALTQEQAQYILGGQANMWTEYMDNSDQVEYMLLPRLLALSEALWSKDKHRNFNDFNKRLQPHKRILKMLGYHYSEGSYQVDILTTYDTAKKLNKVTFETEQYDARIRYTLDGDIPNDSSTLYQHPFTPDSSCIIHAAIFKEGILQRYVSEFHYVKHLGIGKSIVLRKKPSRSYGEHQQSALLDGIRGAENYQDGNWLGFEGKDLIAEIDLGEKTKLHQMSIAYINQPGRWIIPPKSVSVFSSEDGKIYHELAHQVVGMKNADHEFVVGNVLVSFQADSTRYLKVVVENEKKLPPSHPYAGEDAWIFIDEIVLK